MTAPAYPLPPRARRVKDVPLRQRPRELCARAGVENVPDEVLIAVLLRSGIRGATVLDVAHGLLQRYGSLAELAQASVNELAAVRGLGPVRALVLKAALDLARRLAEEAPAPRQPIQAPAQVAALLRERARAAEQEIFWILMLDRRHRLKCPPHDVTQGLVDASLAHPREVFREAVRSNSSAVILAHNHPSGDPTPSDTDLRISRQLVAAGKIVEIPVLDHVILGRAARDRAHDYLSLREAGLVQFE